MLFNIKISKELIAELSSDRYQGRMPLSATEGITVDYIAGQMKGNWVGASQRWKFFSRSTIAGCEFQNLEYA